MLSRCIHENREQNESDDNENYDIQDRNIQEIKDERSRGHNSDENQSHSQTEVQELPSPPFFSTFQHLKPMHEFTLHLPTRYESSLSSPYLLFSTFFSSEQLSVIVQNTNKYAYLKGAGAGRKWKDLTIGEFKIWLAILIYTGIFKLPSIRDYWNADSRFPEHRITTFMTLLRFEQIVQFPLYIVWDLISAGMEENNSTKKPNTRSSTEELAKNIDTHTSRTQYVTSKFELPILRLSPEGHLPEWRKDRISCVWCKYLAKKNNKKASQNPSQSQVYCNKCNVPLCCNKDRANCFKDYHTRKEDSN
ncbi:12241_t:CDS:2 [Dentiscutata heterogama]|uniref:12241_t:CDS:1 n=1 Tax=Dentiscutata heterogama TaxID=1316150 RepID=A0ACA9K720_9GLOM|nr:12241_t:CDS:2 [Dentiscutata heterogama]